MNALPFSHSRRDRAGMVLLEVVTALLVFTLVAFSLVMALDSAFDATFDRNQIDMALRGLDNQLVLLHSARVQPGELDQPDDGSGILYHVSVQQEQMKDQKNQFVPNMYRATITATWKYRGEPQERDVSELIFQP